MGIYVIKRLKWDSECFGYEVGTVSIGTMSIIGGGGKSIEGGRTYVIKKLLKELKLPEVKVCNI